MESIVIYLLTAKRGKVKLTCVKLYYMLEHMTIVAQETYGRDSNADDTKATALVSHFNAAVLNEPCTLFVTAQ